MCPGYAQAHPLVSEAVRAHMAFKAGNWDAIHPHAPADLVDAVEFFVAMLASYEAWAIAEMERKAPK